MCAQEVVSGFCSKNRKERGAARKGGKPLYMCARTSAHLAAFRLHSAAPICELVNKDLGPLLSIPGSRRLSIITFNGLHMELASAGHISIPSYSNVRADCFP